MCKSTKLLGILVWHKRNITYSFSVEDHNDHCRSRCSHVSICPTSPPKSTHSSGNPRDKDDDDSSRRSCPSAAIITLQDAHKIVTNGQKTLQDWNKRWGAVTTTFSFRVVNTILELGLGKVPAISAHGELMAMIRKGKQMLLQLESIAFIDLQSIQAADFPDFWVETIRVIEGIHERIAHANAALQLCLDSGTQARP
jgi:hypothetical protein